ncbi:sensor histidine kinase [Actinoplanes sp. NPDC049265]|uniref:sensor histidine kinase n=1 Tax=Actinoplanes sp. NPDC049265 TaxID=3363902 RepID=UPI00371E8D06
MIRRALLAPLRASTYRRAVFLLLGAVILLPYLLLFVVLGRLLVTAPGTRGTVLLVTVVAGGVALVPPFLSGTRELEIAAARALLRVDLPPPGRPALETRLRSALWFAVHLAVGAAIGVALMAAVPLASSALAGGTGLGVWAGFGRWWWALVGALMLVGTAYATAGLGALAATMAPVLLGPSPAERMAAVEDRERRLAERNRLARELHDSVGHALTATTLQAGAARAVFDRDPEFARRALEAIEELGRSAMDDLDHVLGVLRADDAGFVHRPAARAEVERLLADVRAGGIAVDADLAIGDHLPREAFRMVQESLTNAAKHGSGTVVVRITAAEMIEIEVRNPCDDEPPGRDGRGLTGMRERVTLAGGTVETGRRGDEWVVRARLPRDLGADR